MKDVSINVVPLLVRPLESRPEPRAFALRPVLPSSQKEVLLIAETAGGTQQENISFCMPIVHSLCENVF